MKRVLPLLGCAVFAVAFALTACPGNKGTGNTDGGSDADQNIVDPVITVSGTASIYPPAVGWMQDAGLTLPALAGLTLSVDEPLKVALGDSKGTFGTLTLDSTGTFSVAQVNTALIVLGIAAGVRDESPGVCDGGSPLPDGGGCTLPRVIRAATGIYDLKLQDGTLPQTDITGAKAYAVPTAFHDQLTAAITPARIQSITTGADSTLIAAGFIVGQIIDSAGHPVSGAAIAATNFGSQFFYLTDDFKSVNQIATGNTGLFVFVHNGGQVSPFNFTIANHTEYLERNAGAAPGDALVMIVFPGKTAP